MNVYEWLDSGTWPERLDRAHSYFATGGDMDLGYLSATASRFAGMAAVALRLAQETDPALAERTLAAWDAPARP